MNEPLIVYNSRSRTKETFTPLIEGFVGLYVCGPTVYSNVHLGNVRTFLSFDIIYRYLKFRGNKVRYIRNVTDVGHLRDNGEDRMSLQAQKERLEPMEVAQIYTNDFHDMMRIFNLSSPDIEPRATGHIPEQIEMVQSILDNGYAYEKNGSVYFDTLKFAHDTGIYGELSGRKIEDLMADSRDNLQNQDEKRNSVDFAIWMKASEDHIMRWNSPWSEGFPGWHLECSAMSLKYLGKTFDIHGGGNDLKFPHHENEIAQNEAACKHTGARYWLHTNMLIMNGKKMSKSDGNTISPEELFSGDSPHISKAYSPMAIKFFMLQAHYRSTLDITDAGLGASEKGYKKLMEAWKLAASMNETEFPARESTNDRDIERLINEAYAGMNDDFNTAVAISKLAELSSYIHKLHNEQLSRSEISSNALRQIKNTFNSFYNDIFGLAADEDQDSTDLTDGLMSLILDLRQNARTRKDWAISDQIRDALQSLNIQVKDSKDGSTWIKN